MRVWSGYSLSGHCARGKSANVANLSPTPDSLSAVFAKSIQVNSVATPQPLPSNFIHPPQLYWSRSRARTPHRRAVPPGYSSSPAATLSPTLIPARHEIEIWLRDQINQCQAHCPVHEHVSYSSVVAVLFSKYSRLFLPVRQPDADQIERVREVIPKSSRSVMKALSGGQAAGSDAPRSHQQRVDISVTTLSFREMAFDAELGIRLRCKKAYVDGPTEGGSVSSTTEDMRP